MSMLRVYVNVKPLVHVLVCVFVCVHVCVYNCRTLLYPISLVLE
jgi:hypothetical protein